jgi:hypothetical protein
MNLSELEYLSKGFLFFGDAFEEAMYNDMANNSGSIYDKW